MSKKKKIIVADDESLILNSVRDTLTDDYDVYKASNGEEVFKVMKKIHPDLIILDIMMPVMNGIEACRKLMDKESTSKIPVMFLTAKAQIKDIEKGFKAGAKDYVIKPFSAAELLEKVNFILR